MNRAQRRKMMKKNPQYKKLVKENATAALNNLEEVFKKRWHEDETLNEGYREEDDDGEDDIYND